MLIKKGQVLLWAASVENTSQTDVYQSLELNICYWFFLKIQDYLLFSHHLSALVFRVSKELATSFFEIREDPGSQLLGYHTQGLHYHQGYQVAANSLPVGPSSWISPHDEHLLFTRTEVKVIGEGNSAAKTKHQSSLRNPQPLVCGGRIISQSQIKATRRRQENQWEISIFRKCV